MSSAVAHALPPSILALFAPRVPIDYKPPLEKRTMPPYTGFAKHVDQFEDPAETPPAQPVESIEQRRARRREAKAAAAKARLEPLIAAYDPSANAEGKSADPYKTIFVARMDHSTTEATLRKEFEQFGPIKSVQIVKDTATGKSRGYSFIEYEHERDMKVAYKQGDAKKIDGRRVLVDVERGRTVRNWRPRRLGGGLGSTRAGGKGQAVQASGRAAASTSGAATVAAPSAAASTRPADRPTERPSYAVGGGAPANPSCIPLIQDARKTGWRVVLLTSPIDVLVKRLSKDLGDRAALTKHPLAEELAQLSRDRSIFYSTLADAEVDGSSDPAIVCAAIAALTFS